MDEVFRFGSFSQEEAAYYQSQELPNSKRQHAASKEQPHKSQVQEGKLETNRASFVEAELMLPPVPLSAQMRSSCSVDCEIQFGSSLLNSQTEDNLPGPRAAAGEKGAEAGGKRAEPGEDAGRGGKVELAAGGTELAANKVELAAGGTELAANKVELAAGGTELEANKVELAAGGTELAANSLEVETCAGQLGMKVKPKSWAALLSSSSSGSRSNGSTSSSSTSSSARFGGTLDSKGRSSSRVEGMGHAREDEKSAGTGRWESESKDETRGREANGIWQKNEEVKRQRSLSLGELSDSLPAVTAAEQTRTEEQRRTEEQDQRLEQKRVAQQVKAPEQAIIAGQVETTDQVKPTVEDSSSSSRWLFDVDEWQRLMSAWEPSENQQSLFLKPRGIVNSGNLCFANATVQALLSCPPLLLLLRGLAGIEQQKLTHAPISCTMLAVLNEFEQGNTRQLLHTNPSAVAAAPSLPHASATAPLAPVRSSQHVPVASTPHASAASAAPRLHPAASLTGRPLSPLLLSPLLSRFSPQHHRNGLQLRQEDAQEFLLFLLDQLHEELVQLSHSLGNEARGSAETQSLSSSGGGSLDSVNDGEEDWEMVGRRNKSAVTRTHAAEKSVLTDIFGGEMRSVVKTTGLKPSAMLQPFTLLQLNISPPSVLSLEDALRQLAAVEQVEGYRGKAEGGSRSASKSLKIQSLPRILVLHLMRFSYGPQGSSKLHKAVSFPLLLSLPRELVAVPKESCRYELLASVVHHGRDPSSGHYTADVKQGGEQWLRFDDAKVFLVAASRVLKEEAYLLFYRRLQG